MDNTTTTNNNNMTQPNQEPPTTIINNNNDNDNNIIDNVPKERKLSQSSSSSSSLSIDDNANKKQSKENIIDNSSSSSEDEDNKLKHKRNRTLPQNKEYSKYSNTNTTNQSGITSGNSSIKKDIQLQNPISSSGNSSSVHKAKPLMPGLDGPLISESLFTQLQEGIDKDEIALAYNEYKTKYENKKYLSFYSEHQNDEWFKEKYHPDIYYAMKNEQDAQCKRLCILFNNNIMNNNNNETLIDLSYIQNKTNANYHNVNFVIYDFNNETRITTDNDNNTNNNTTTTTTNIVSETTQQLDIDLSLPPFYGFEPDKMTLFIHQVPRHISKKQIIEVARKLSGFVYLSLSEPIKAQDYNRYCWLTFDSEQNSKYAMEVLKDFQVSTEYKINPKESESSTIKTIRITPYLYTERIDEDIEFTKQIITILNKDKKINEPPSFDNIEPKLKRLDLQLLYLRKVHAFCYYCFEYFDDERNLSSKCDNIHLHNEFICSRNDIETSIPHKDIINAYDKLLTSKANEFVSKGEIERTIKAIDYDNEILERRRNEYCKEKTLTVSAERFKCQFCEKMFKGSHYVVNHIKNKHPHFVKDIDKKYADEIKKENYLNDSKKNVERIKVINQMNEYYNYLNEMKKCENGNNNRDNRGDNKRDRYYNRNNDYRSNKDFDKGRHMRRYGNVNMNDYDDGDGRRHRNNSGNSGNNSNNMNGNAGNRNVNINQGRQLVSYHDL